MKALHRFFETAAQSDDHSGSSQIDLAEKYFSGTKLPDKPDANSSAIHNAGEILGIDRGRGSRL